MNKPKLSEDTTTADLKIGLPKVGAGQNFDDKKTYNEPDLGLCKLRQDIIEHHVSRSRKYTSAH